MGPNSHHQNFFSKTWHFQSLNIMDSYDHVQYQRKTNDPIMKKVSDRRTDGRTDRQTDESYLIGRCPTNFERPIVI